MIANPITNVMRMELQIAISVQIVKNMRAFAQNAMSRVVVVQENIIMTNPPKWLVMAADNNLYGYFNKQILQIDLAINKEEKVSIFQLLDGIKIKYVPIKKEELNEPYDFR
jgi:hypothetical protein